MYTITPSNIKEVVGYVQKAMNEPSIEINKSKEYLYSTLQG